MKVGGPLDGVGFPSTFMWVPCIKTKLLGFLARALPTELFCQPFLFEMSYRFIHL